jgi:opine dehydrogenase
MKRIAVLGAGGTGHALAADLTLAGLEVILYEEPEFKERLEFILTRGGIEITGSVRQGCAEVSKVTTEIEEALKDAEIILVAVIANRHERIAELCAPYLEDGQTIAIGPDNGGSLVFANILKSKGVKSDVSIAGIGSNYYSCRLIAPAKVLAAFVTRTRRIAAFPAKDTDKVINKLSKLNGRWDFVAGTNVLEVALSSPNIVVHVAGSLLNTGAIEKSGGVYYLSRQGITPSVLRCIDAVRKERLALFEALGYTISPSDFFERAANVAESPELEIFRGLIGPTSMQHRYITEDAFIGQVLMVSLGEMINVPTPVTKALVTLASVINQTDYMREGRTIETLGLSGLSIVELNRFLAQGSY